VFLYAFRHISADEGELRAICRKSPFLFDTVLTLFPGWSILYVSEALRGRTGTLAESGRTRIEAVRVNEEKFLQEVQAVAFKNLLISYFHRR
jgi:hypothetical protein